MTTKHRDDVLSNVLDLDAISDLPDEAGFRAWLGFEMRALFAAANRPPALRRWASQGGE